MEKEYYNTAQNFLDEDFEFLVASDRICSAAILGWKAVLQKIFTYNFSQKNTYSSTESALLVFYKTVNNRELSENIHIIYILITQLEYSGCNIFLEKDVVNLISKIQAVHNNLKKL